MRRRARGGEPGLVRRRGPQRRPSAMAGLVVGMSFDLSRGLDEVLQNSSIMGDDLYHGGSYAGQGLFNRGVILKEDVNGMWGEMHRARWVAESGIERMKTVLDTAYEHSVLAVRANIYAGFANRLLGEHVCDAVIDGGASQDFTAHFERADSQFTEALRLAGQSRPPRFAIRCAAWRTAVARRCGPGSADGRRPPPTRRQQVPTSFVYSRTTRSTRRLRTTIWCSRRTIAPSTRSTARSGRSLPGPARPVGHGEDVGRRCSGGPGRPHALLPAAEIQRIRRRRRADERH